jgi:hypothetical protein
MNAELSSKLCAIQSKLKAPKGQFNKFGKYNYRNCEDILEAVKPLLADVGMSIVISDDVKLVGDRVYVVATVTLYDGKDSVSNTAFAREALTKKGMDESQITGAASSYARKYALNGMFCIDDTKDADSQDNSTGAATVPSSDDMSWVNAIKAGSAKLEEINDPKYREYIGGLL